MQEGGGLSLQEYIRVEFREQRMEVQALGMSVDS